MLYHNELTRLPAEIGQLSDLKILKLYANDLVSLPPEIGDLTSLCYLSLRYNKLQHLPTELGQLRGLSNNDSCALGLDGNPLISPPVEVIAQGYTSRSRLFTTSNMVASATLDLEPCNRGGVAGCAGAWGCAGRCAVIIANQNAKNDAIFTLTHDIGRSKNMTFVIRFNG